MPIQVTLYLVSLLAIYALPVSSMPGGWVDVTDDDADNLVLAKQMIESNVNEDYKAENNDVSGITFSFAKAKKKVVAGLIYQMNFTITVTYSCSARGCSEKPSKTENWTAQVFFEAAEKSPIYATNGYPKCVD